MDLDDWRKQEEARTKKKSRVAQIDWIYRTASGELGATGPSSLAGTVKMIECDYGTLVAAVRGTQIHHYLANHTVDGVDIRERGLEPWPRGATRLLDDMCDMLDGEMLGDDRATKVFMDKHGPIAQARRDAEVKTRKRRRRR